MVREVTMLHLTSTILTTFKAFLNYTTVTLTAHHAKIDIVIYACTFACACCCVVLETKQHVKNGTTILYIEIGYCGLLYLYYF